MTPHEAAGHAARALSLWGGGTVRQLCALRENAVFEVTMQDGRRAALRLHRAGYQTDAAIAAEMAWTAALSRDGFPCAAPVATPDGDLLGRPAFGPRATMVAWIDADPLSDWSGPPDARAGWHYALGGLLARLHRLSDNWTPPDGFARPIWDADALAGSAPRWGPFWRNPALSQPEAAILIAGRDLARNALAQGQWDCGLIHADALGENVLIGADGLHLIDFDDGGPGLRAYDLGCAMVQHLGTVVHGALSDALLRGYADGGGRPVAPRDLAMFTMLRAMASLGWLMSRAGPDDPRHAAYAARAVTAAGAWMAAQAQGAACETGVSQSDALR